MELGIVFAIITIFLFGSWAVPTKTIKVDPKVQSFWLTIAHLLLSASIFFLLGKNISLRDSIVPFLGGVVWGVGMIFGFIAIKQIGITRALGIWSPTTILVSALWGLIFFGEAQTLGSQRLIFNLIAILLLITAALLIIVSGKADKITGNFKLGIVAAIILGICHGSFFVPLQSSPLPIYATFLPLTIGMVCTTFLAAKAEKLKIKHGLTDTLKMMAAGFILGAGNYTTLLTVSFLGVSRGYPPTELGLVINTLWGIFFFKEVTSRRGKILISLGILAAIAGMLFVNAAR